MKTTILFQNKTCLKLLLTFSFLLVVSVSFATDYYWVGGNGNWNDTSHWATSSGGTNLHSSAPTGRDNVFFDSNSGTDVIVNITSEDAKCKNMTWSNVPGTPKLLFDSSSRKLTIYGNVILQNGMSFGESSSWDSVMWEPSASSTWRSNGVKINRAFLIAGAGSKTFMDDTVFLQEMYEFSDGDITFNMTVQFMGETIFYGTSKQEFRGDIVDSGSISYEDGDKNIIMSGINVKAVSLNFDSGSSLDISGSVFDIEEEFYIRRYNNVDVSNSDITVKHFIGFGNNNVIFPSVKILNGGKLGYSDAFPDPSDIPYKFDRLEFFGTATIYESTESNDLILSPNTVARFNPNSLHTVNNRFYASAPDCSGFIELRTIDDSGVAFFDFTSGSTLELKNVLVSNIEASGNIPVEVDGGFDAGNNTGFNINNGNPKTYYWIGGSGNWNDSEHWTTNADGSPSTLRCIPTANDDVVFNSNSGTSPHVTISEGVVSFNNMTWDGVLGTPKLIGTDPNTTIMVFGDVILQENMSFLGSSYNSSSIIWDSEAEQKWISNGVVVNLPLIVKGTGKRIFIDTFSTPHDLRVLDDTDVTFNGDFIVDTFGNNGNGDLLFNGKVNASTGIFIGGSGQHQFLDDVFSGDFELDQGINILKDIHLTAGNLYIEKIASPFYFDVSGSILDVSKWEIKLTSDLIDVSNTVLTTDWFMDFSNVSENSKTKYPHIRLVDGGDFFWVDYDEEGTSSVGKLEILGEVDIYISINADEVFLEPGAVINYNFDKVLTVSNIFSPSGTPCNWNKIIGAPLRNSETPESQVYINVLAGNTNYNYIKLEDVDASGSYQPWQIEKHNVNLGNNININFKQGEPSEITSVDGLPDQISVETFPYTISTANFLPTVNTQFLWNDGSTNKELVVNTPGTYSVTVTYEDNCVVSDQVQIQRSFSALTVAISADQTICSGESVSITVTIDGGTPPYTINYPGGSATVSSTGTSSPQATYIFNSGALTTNTIYDNTNVTVTDANGNTATHTSSAQVTVLPAPNRNFTITDGVVCDSGQPATLTLSSSESGVTYQLQTVSPTVNVGAPVPGDGNELTFSVNPSVTTEYQVLATSGSNSCSAIINDRATVVHRSRPITTYTFSPTETCEGSDAVIAMTDSELGVEYQLQLQDGTDVGSTVVGSGSVVFFNTGNVFTTTTYQVEASVMGANGCSEMLVNQPTVTVNPLPTFDIEIGNTSCFESSPPDGWIEVTPTSNDGPFTIELYKDGVLMPSGGTVTNVSTNHTFQNLGKGEYQIRITSSNGCKNN